MWVCAKSHSVTKSKLARGSGRQHKAWGEAKRNPRKQEIEKTVARGAADSPRHGKCYRPLRGLPLSFDHQPGVPLRSTPGFMLSPAAAGWVVTDPVKCGFPTSLDYPV